MFSYICLKLNAADTCYSYRNTISFFNLLQLYLILHFKKLLRCMECCGKRGQNNFRQPNNFSKPISKLTSSLLGNHVMHLHLAINDQIKSSCQL